MFDRFTISVSRKPCIVERKGGYFRTRDTRQTCLWGYLWSERPLVAKIIRGAEKNFFPGRKLKIKKKFEKNIFAEKIFLPRRKKIFVAAKIICGRKKYFRRSENYLQGRKKFFALKRLFMMSEGETLLFWVVI